MCLNSETGLSLQLVNSFAYIIRHILLLHWW